MTLPRAHVPLVDALGNVHPRATREPRIVALVPSITELLFALGLAERVVGRTTFCIHPAGPVDAIPRVGGTKKVHLDRLRALAPTHVIVNVDENDRAQVEQMAEFVPHVLVTHPLGPDDNPALYRLLGSIFDREPEAERLARGYARARERLCGEVSGLPARDVLYLIWRDPWMTVSRDTYVARYLALAGLRTIPHDDESRYPVVDLSGPAARGADLVLLSSEPFPFKARHRDEVAGHLAPGTDIRFIDGEMASWYGSRAVPALGYLASFARALAGEPR